MTSSFNACDVTIVNSNYKHFTVFLRALVPRFLHHCYWYRVVLRKSLVGLSLENAENKLLKKCLKLKLLRGPNEDLQSNPRAALWRWRNNGATCTLLEAAFKSYFLEKVSWVIGNSFQAFSKFVWKEHADSIASRALLNTGGWTK